MRQWTVSIAVLSQDNTWQTIDYNVEALGSKNAIDRTRKMAEEASDIGLACFLGIWEDEGDGEEE